VHFALKQVMNVSNIPRFRLETRTQAEHPYFED
jgi:hypothetical protein